GASLQSRCLCKEAHPCGKGEPAPSAAHHDQFPKLFTLCCFRSFPKGSACRWLPFPLLAFSPSRKEHLRSWSKASPLCTRASSLQPPARVHVVSGLRPTVLNKKLLEHLADWREKSSPKKYCLRVRYIHSMSTHFKLITFFKQRHYCGFNL